MEYMDSRITLEATHTAAPALSRGIAILQTLALESPLSLETIASRLRLPKASLFRLLETLQGIGCVRKTVDKKYEPIQILKPVSDSRISFVDTLISCMRRLCEQTDCTIEWYECASDGMQMIRQELPETEVCVRARPGAVFYWGMELTAVTKVGYAFANNAPAPKGTFSTYKSNGVSTKISLSYARREIQETKKNGFGKDAAFNINGVRRWAIPVFRGNQFLGTLAIASNYRFNQLDQSNHLLSLMHAALKQLKYYDIKSKEGK